MATVHLWTNHKQFTTKTMKKILFSLAAVAAMVGCAKDAPIVNNNNNNQPEETLAISASIDLSDTRVTIDGEEFTNVAWEKNDVIRFASVARVDAQLVATEAGDTDVRFKATGSYAADTDTYYAIYPDVAITEGVASIDLATQTTGEAKGAAVLAAKAENAAKGVIDMSFSPINALLHVAVSGNTAQIMKAEFLAYNNGAKLPKGFTYNFTDGSVAHAGEVASYVIETPDAEGFFFSLPAGLDMSAGYIVRLTDNDGKVCSKAYNGKTFAQGTTTRVNVEWSQPTVTLNSGEPKTSYSYYAAGKPLEANKCANNIIYFDGCTYSYANLQDAMIAEVGAYVGNTHYPGGTIDTANNRFTPNDVTVSSWTAYDVQAYVKTKDQKYFYSGNPTKVYITGLPLTSTFINTSSMPAYWNASNHTFDGYGWNAGDGTKYLRLKGRKNQSDRGYLYSNAFHLPSNINAQVMLDYKYYRSSSKSAKIDVKASSTSISNSCSGEYSVSSKDTFGDNFDSIANIYDDMTLTSSTPCVLITQNSDPSVGLVESATAFIGVKTITVSYR